MNKETKEKMADLEIFKYAELYGMEACYEKFNLTHARINSLVTKKRVIPDSLPYNSQMANFISEKRDSGCNYPMIHAKLKIKFSQAIPIPIIKSWLKLQRQINGRKVILPFKEHENESPVVPSFLMINQRSA